MGAAISLFEGASAVKVPRARFYPVKTCNDLLIVRSNCFVYSKDETLQINPQKKVHKNQDTIKVALDSKYYSKIDDLDERFANGVPSLVDCDSLTIEGDVKFEKDVIINGSVAIKNTQQTQAVVKEGTIIDEDLVF
jgi:UTP--glucose-1-phosphate uridylyltransferase